MRTLALLCVIALPASAQDVLDPQGPAEPRGHDVVRNPRTGDCVVAWISGSGTSRTVTARRYGSNGQWSDAVTVDSFAGTVQEIAISCGLVSETEERYLVVWRDTRGGADEIYGRILDRSLAPVGSSFRVSDFGDSGADAAPDAAWNRDRWLVVWAHTNPVQEIGRSQFSRHFEVNDDIAGRFVTTSGMPAGSFRVTDEAIDTKNPAVAAQGDAFFSCWQEHPGPQRPPRVWGAPIAMNGTVGLVAPYGTGTGANQVRPRLATKPDGTAMMVWSVQTADGRTGELSSTAVGTRRVQGDGRYAAPAQALDTGARGTPSIIFFPERGQYLVVYEVVSSVSTSIDVKGRFIDAQTGELKSIVKLLNYGDLDEKSPRVAPQPNGQPLTVAQRGQTGENRELVVSYSGEDSKNNDNGNQSVCGFAAGAVSVPWALVLLALLSIGGLCRR